MITKTINLNIYALPVEGVEDGFEMHAVSDSYRWSMSMDAVKISEKEIDCDIDPANHKEFIEKAIATLSERKTLAKERYLDEVNELDNKIRSLMYLEAPCSATLEDIEEIPPVDSYAKGEGYPADCEYNQEVK